MSKPLDPDQLADAMVRGAQAYINAQLSPILKRLADTEAAIASHQTLERMVESAVATAVKAIPPAEPGKSVTVEDCRAVIEEAAAKAASDAVARLPVAKDGLGYSDAMIDRDGALILTRTDGSTVKLGSVVGKSLEPGDLAPMVADLVAKAVSALPKPKDGEPGKSVDVADVERMISERVAKAVSALPPAEPLPAAEVDMGAVAEMVRGAVGDAVKAIPPIAAPELPDIPALVKDAVAALPRPKDGDPGRSVTVDDVRPLIEEEIKRSVAALPKPKDGDSVTVDDVRPVLAELVRSAVEALPTPLGYSKGLIDREGHLVFTRTDGTTENVGMIVGKDADADAMMKALTARLDEAIAAIPAPEHGKDGLGFDDLDLAFDGERTISFKFQRGDQVKEFPFTLPVVLDRGVWQERGVEGAGYKKGDGVSWGGSFYIARKDTFAKPDDFEAWRLSVKRGKDAKEPVNLK